MYLSFYNIIKRQFLLNDYTSMINEIDNVAAHGLWMYRSVGLVKLQFVRKFYVLMPVPNSMVMPPRKNRSWHTKQLIKTSYRQLTRYTINRNAIHFGPGVCDRMNYMSLICDCSFFGTKGTCEFCGFYGIKDQFFSKSKRFCKVECAKKYSASNIKKRKTDRITPTKRRTVRRPTPSKKVCYMARKNITMFVKLYSIYSTVVFNAYSISTYTVIILRTVIVHIL